MKRLVPIFVLVGLLCTGCTASRRQSASVDFFAMDTAMTVLAYGPGAKQAAVAAETAVEQLDQLLSISNPSSDVCRFNETGRAALDPQTETIVRSALELYESTGGAFDITIAPVEEAWGFYSEEQAVPSEKTLQERLALVGSDALSLEGSTLQAGRPGVKMDLGGIAKGYASDVASETLAQSGISSAVISLGGNVCVLGKNPDGSDWKVAITDPFDASAYLGILSCHDTSVVTSGSYIRYFEQDGISYHHILDPATGYPAASGLVSVSIVCPSGLKADGLSTALFIMGLEQGHAYWQKHSDEFDAIFVLQDGRVYITSGLRDTFTSAYELEVLSP